METFGELRNAMARLRTPSSMFPEEGNEKNRVLLVSVITINGQGRLEEGVRDPDFRFVYRNLQRIIGAKSIKDTFLGHHLP